MRIIIIYYILRLHQPRISNFNLWHDIGFLTTEDDVVPGNMGLYDQRALLIWIQQNIRNFGGDPTRVTISGQSAGASSSSLHIISPLSEGLYAMYGLGR
jgi:carboxylesterase type B